jgi:hypothetical protein
VEWFTPYLSVINIFITNHQRSKDMKKTLILLVLFLFGLALVPKLEAQYTPGNLPEGTVIESTEKEGNIYVCEGCWLYFKYFIIEITENGNTFHGALVTDIWFVGDCDCADFANDNGEIINYPPWDAILTYIFSENSVFFGEIGYCGNENVGEII